MWNKIKIWNPDAFTSDRSIISKIEWGLIKTEPIYTDRILICNLGAVREVTKAEHEIPKNSRVYEEVSCNVMKIPESEVAKVNEFLNTSEHCYIIGEFRNYELTVLF